MAKSDYIKMKVEMMIQRFECPPQWHKFARIVELFIMDAFVDLFITLCIMINTLFMAIDRAGMSPEETRTLAIGNYVSRYVDIYSRTVQ